MIWYVIPAKKNSERLPHKNRKLLPYTLKEVAGFENVIVSTDDEWIESYCKDRGVKTCTHPRFFSPEEETTREVLAHVVNLHPINGDDIIVMLYLTYPERTKEEINKFVEYFDDHSLESNYQDYDKHHTIKSMLCKKDLSGAHPYLFMFGYENGAGMPLINHDLCRSQDYPTVFEISHYIFACRADELRKLNKNLYNQDTRFYPIGNKIDVDTEKDLERFTK